MARQALDKLARLRRYTLNEKRQMLAAAETEARAVEDAIAALEEAVRGEATRVASIGDTRLGFTLAAYLHAKLNERRHLADQQSLAEAECQCAREALRAAYRALKSVELVITQRVQAAAAEARRRETQALDELALQRSAAACNRCDDSAA